MNKKYLFTFVLSGILILTYFTGSILAQEPTFDEVNAIAEQLNCPTCAGINLADCNTQTCAQWKDQIKDKLAEGFTDQEVLDWYAARYGDQVLQKPPRRGIGLYVWVLPIVGLLAGGAWLGLILKRWSTAQARVNTVETSISSQMDETDDYVQRVEQDLKRL